MTKHTMTVVNPTQMIKKSSNRQFSIAKKEQILADYALLYKSRVVSNHIRRDVLTGKAKFGIESSGMELLQLALADHFQKGDFYSGYYRDQSFMLKKGIASIQEIFSSLYADIENDKYSGGRQMNGHFATPFANREGKWAELTAQYNVSSALAPLAAHVPRALGLALASKKFRTGDFKLPGLSNNGNEISFCIIGDATAAEGVFFEAVNAACVMQVPIIFVIQDNGYGISVPVDMQTAKGSISEALKGLQRNNPSERALEIYTAHGWDYPGLQDTFAKATALTREEHSPCIIHITEVTQGNGHSTSGSHERYKPAERLDWEKEKDCLVHFEQWIISNQLADDKTLEEIRTTATAEFKKEKQAAWTAYQGPFKLAHQELTSLLTELANSYPDQGELHDILKELKILTQGEISHLLLLIEKVFYSWNPANLAALANLQNWFSKHKENLTHSYKTDLHSETNQAAIKIPAHPVQYDSDSPMVNGYEVLNKFFDQLFERDNRVYAFGEDVGKIGGVNQGFVGLQKKHGEDRIFDTGIREWTIAGQAIGMAARGLRPIGEIQYLDYLVYALPALTDDLATLRWRTNGIQKSPTIIRTRGHRLEGIWHTGSPMSMLLGSLRGIYLLTPRNMTQAVGMYNTMLQSDDPAIIIEPLNGYRKKEKLPTNLDRFTVALGSPEILHTGKDITLVTYGSCIPFAEKAVEQLKKYEISVELIDVQSLLPFDLEHQIVASLQKTNRIIFMDEDVPGGATAYMMQKVLEEQGGYNYLDAMPLTISAKAHRTAYGDSGNYIGKPGVFEIVTAAIKLMEDDSPQQFGNLAKLFQ